ncbi:MAG TPA: hypothetical protein VF590_03555 [Isosphaeraceae bacterium]|jgi:hypothetical protein
MYTIKLTSRIGMDGKLKLEVPLGFTNRDVEVVVVIQPRPAADAATAPEDRGWPVGFFEETYGSLRDVPLTREPEGDFETREPLA